MRIHGRINGLLACAVALLLTASGGNSAPIGDAELRDSGKDQSNWLMYGRTYEDHRFSPLKQISEKSIGKLGLAWSRELTTTRGLEATPLVQDGILYTTSAWSVVHAMDAKTGKTLWTYDPRVPRARAYFICCDVVNRGVALYGGKVYVGTLDGRLIALNQRTGSPVWDVSTADSDKPYAITGAPRIARGMVVIGNAGAEYGVRGYISAYDAETGKMAWRFYTVPGDPSKGFESKAMADAAKTWKGEWWKVGGGGTAWEGIVYDPSLDLLYFGTGNPTAWYRDLRGGNSDNLYTASILAVRARTGELAWHFQTTPGDNWDFDSTQPLVQADLFIGGRPRMVIMQANKNGFFYVLDRATGEFLSGKAFVSGITWAKGLDPKTGRPIEEPDASKPAIISPAPDGAHNWNPMAFSPESGLVYFPAKIGTQSLHVPDTNWKYNPDKSNLGRAPGYEGPLAAKLKIMPPPTGELLAWNPVTQRAAWRAKYPVAVGGGVLATAGNLVFQGRADGILAAYRATDGKQMWSFDAKTGIMAPPVTYQIDGVQYVSVLAGWGGPDGLGNDPSWGPTKPGFGRILTFVLGGKTPFNPPAFGHKFPPPMPALTVDSNSQLVRQGELLFGDHCAGCHGANAIAGPLPDLRYSSKATLEGIQGIVLGGTRAAMGMPSFAKILNPGQVRAIQAYIVWRARAGAMAATVKKP